MVPSGVNAACLDKAAEDTKDAGTAENGFGYSPKRHSPPKLLHNIKGIIFDFDGTLFDNARIAFFLIAAYPADVLRIWKERLVRKRFAGCDYFSPGDYYAAFFAALGKSCFCSPERMRKWYFDRYMPRMARVLKKHYEPRPGARELFRRIAAPAYANGRPLPSGALGLAVYSDYPFLKERMEALGMDTGGIPLYGPESFGAQKPAARPFLRIAADLGARPEEILVIGDRTETDGIGAFNAGMRFFCLEKGRRRYFRLDPCRRRPKKEPHGPSLVMRAGIWDDLIKLLLQSINSQI